MQFKDIPYKEEEKRKLTSQVDSDRIPHAQLFLGKEGSANLPLALAYISYIYCTDKKEGDSCGLCQNCNFTSKFIHADIHFSFPVVKLEPKKREDTTSDDFLGIWRTTLTMNPNISIHDWQTAIGAQSTKPNINSKECNDIIHKLSYQSFADGPKVLLMWMPEYLGKEGNKLLKLIEEPTPNTYIILVANDQSRILSTILSRCQLMKFLPYNETEILNFVIDKYQIEQGLALQYAKLSQGNISKALDLCKGLDKNLSSFLFDWLRACYKEDAQEIMQIANEINSWNLDSQIQFLEYALHYFQAYIHWILTNAEKPNLSAEEAIIAGKMKNSIDVQKAELIVEIINNLIIYFNRNANVKINIVADSISIGDILKNKEKTKINSRIFAKETLLLN